ncbi:MAG TPA: hypothetical protein VHP83_24290 [Aggregatilineaceae bacterium]|nr:hypothetical protein [Aggregatilineaceae bacterium]
MVKSSPWMDRLSLISSLVIVFGAVGWLWHTHALSVSLVQDNTLSWHLVRSGGITAYALMTASMVWGLFISSKVVKDWSPGVVSMLLHAALSWLAVVFGIGHGMLLLADKYYTYQLSDILIPFTGPYRPLAVGLGVVSFWITLVVTLSFSSRKRLGNHTWKTLHLSSYLAFGLATVHGLLAGTDADRLGFRLVMVVSVISVVSLLVYRTTKQTTRPKSHHRTTAPAVSD